MIMSRVDHQTLRAAAELSNDLVEQVRLMLRPHLLTELTDEERASTIRSPIRATEAGRATAQAALGFPTVTAAAEYDPEAVLTNLDNVAALAGFAEAVREIAQWVDDSKLVWTAEAYQQGLTLYNVAKPLEKKNGSLRVLVEPFEQMFARRRKPATQEEAEPVSTEGSTDV